MKIDWNKKVSVLNGKTIKMARYMTPEEAEEMGWHSRALVLFFDDGNDMILQCDDEGNEAGAASTSIKGLEIIPVI